jgi:PKD repeat protein
MALLLNPAAAGISAGTTSATFSGNSPSGFSWITELFDYEVVKVRVKVGTTTGVYTITGASSDDIYLPPGQGGPGNGYFAGGSCSITGLTSNTPYFYMMQVSIFGGSWQDSYDGEGTFTTAASPPPAPVADFSATPLTGSAPLYVTFSDSATNTPAAWTWAYGDTSPAYQTNYRNPMHVYLSPGTFTVTQTVANGGGTDSEVKTGFITVLSSAPSVDFTATPTSTVRGGSILFTDLSTGSPTSWAWRWSDSPRNVVLYGEDITRDFEQTGTYTVTHTATNAVGSSSSSKSSFITVIPIPCAATYTAAPVSGYAPLTVQFYGSPSGDSTSASWNFGDGSTASGVNPLHTYYGTIGTETYSPVFSVLPVSGGSASTVTRTGYISLVPDTTYVPFLDELRKKLLIYRENESACNAFVDFGGVNTVLRYTYNRICRLQLETGILRKTSTTITPVSAGVLTLPSDLIELRAVYVNGQRLHNCDPRMADLAQNDWQSAVSGDYLGWYLEPGNSLTLHLVPAITPSTFEIYYVYAPAEPGAGNCGSETFPIPFLYWWVVKYGVLADLLGNEGEMYDIKRAQLCERIFQEGIQIIKASLDGE